MSTHAETRSELPESDVFHILGNDRRREIVSVLAAEDDRIDVSDIARTVASREVDPGDSVPNNLYKSVYVSLQQTHLPQLEADGVVVYDTEEKTIRPGPHFDHVREYIGGTATDGRPFRYATFAVAVTGLALIGLSGADLPLVGALAPVTWAALSLFAIAIGCLIWGQLWSAWAGSLSS